MFKTMLVLDEKKIEDEGLYSVIQCQNTLEKICEDEHLCKEINNLFALENGIDSLGTRLTLLGKLQKTNLLYYLSEWVNFDDEESENGRLEKSDMLQVCRKRGLI